MKYQTLAVAIGSLLVGGVATAAYMNNRAPSSASASIAAIEGTAQSAQMQASPRQYPPPQAVEFDAFADRPHDGRISVNTIQNRLDYAEVLDIEPVTKRQTLYATVIGTSPVRETVVANTPREICDDVVVQDRLPERDGNVGGTVAGAVIGGLVGNQVGDGNGRKLATVAGAVGGGFAGREIDRRHIGGRVVNRTERQCRTVSSSSTSSRTVAWDVTYREPDGHTDTMRTNTKPGKRIALGTEKKVIGYDVTYRYRGGEGRLRLDERPEERLLPVVDGRVVTGLADKTVLLPSRG
jgi:uncharacterized protein YcfJ